MFVGALWKMYRFFDRFTPEAEDHTKENIETIDKAHRYLKGKYDQYGGDKLELGDTTQCLYNPVMNTFTSYKAHAKLKNDKARAYSKFIKVFVFAAVAACLKICSSKFRNVPKLTEVLTVYLLAQVINMIDTIAFEFLKVPEFMKEVEFYMSCGGGNIVGTLLKMFDKAGYIEARIMDCQASFGDTQRQIVCLKFV